VRFPAPPDEPRLVFLTTLEQAAGEISDQTPLEQFLFGRVDSSSSSMVTPYGIDVHNGQILVCDTQQAFVHGFDLPAGKRFRLGSSGEGRTQEPVDVAVAQDGTRYVADTGRNQVLVFTLDNSFSGTLGGAAASGWTDGDDRFKPVSVAVSQDRLVVANGALNRIELYQRADGSLIKSITAGDKGEFHTLSGVDVDAQGRIYAVDSIAARAHVFSPEGQPLLSFGKPGSTLGRMARPRRVDVSADGVIYIADALFHHVHMFNDQGRMLMFLGGAGSSPGCTNTVADVSCDASLLSYFAKWVPTDFEPQYLVFVANQLGPGRVNIYAFGQKRP
jgi:hypothetical protein